MAKQSDNRKKVGQFVRVTYGMKAKRLGRGGQPVSVTIKNGTDVKVEKINTDSQTYEVRAGGVRYLVSWSNLEANGPKDLQDLLRF